jgi:hypothetical protein
MRQRDDEKLWTLPPEIKREAPTSPGSSFVTIAAPRPRCASTAAAAFAGPCDTARLSPSSRGQSGRRGLRCTAAAAAAHALVWGSEARQRRGRRKEAEAAAGRGLRGACRTPSCCCGSKRARSRIETALRMTATEPSHSACVWEVRTSQRAANRQN